MTEASISLLWTECAVIFYIIDRPLVIIIGEKKKQSRLPVTQYRHSFLRFAYLTVSAASWQENSTTTRTRLLAPLTYGKLRRRRFNGLVRNITEMLLVLKSPTYEQKSFQEIYNVKVILPSKHFDIDRFHGIW